MEQYGRTSHRLQQSKDQVKLLMVKTVVPAALTVMDKQEANRVVVSVVVMVLHVVIPVLPVVLSLAPMLLLVHPTTVVVMMF